MVTFDDLLADVDPAFDELAEAATYIKADGTTRAIMVVVEREPLDQIVEIGRGTAPVISFSAPNHATRGITTAEWQPTDKLRIKVNYGETSTTDLQLSEPPSGSDGGRIFFRLNQ